MTIRFNPDLYANILAGLNTNNQQEQQALTELSSGRRVNAPSDDPFATAIDIGIHAQSQQIDQFTQNLAGIQGELQTADSSLGTANTILTQALSLGVEAGNSDLTASDRTAIADQIQSISQQMMSVANTTYQGKFIFAGTASNAPAYVANAANPGGVSYQGNSGVNQIEISSGEKITVNMPGTQIFSQPGADVFAALSGLQQAAQSGNGVSAAMAQLQTAMNNVNGQRTFYGSALNQVTGTETALAADKVQLSSQETTVVGADMAAAATMLSQVTVARQALMAAGGKIPTQNLFDFIQ